MRWLTLFFLAVLSLVGASSESAFEDEFYQLHGPRISKALAQLFYQGSQEHSKEYIANMIRGMQSICDQANKENLPRGYLARADYGLAKGYFRAQQNLQCSDNLFRELSLDLAFTPVIGGWVYYRTLIPANGDVFHDRVKDCHLSCAAHVVEETSKNFPYQTSIQQTYVRVDDLIPGMVYGMQGMKVGERREIFVHPCLGYGCQSNFEPGVSLHFIVELLAIHDTHDEAYPLWQENLYLVPEKVNMITQEQLDQLNRARAFEEGTKLWAHFESISDLCSLESLTTHLHRLAETEHELMDNDEAYEILTKLQFIICQRAVAAQRQAAG